MFVYELYSDERFQSQVVEDDDFDTLQLIELFNGTPITCDLPKFRLIPNSDYDPLPSADFELLTGKPLLSERAVNALADILDANGQLFRVDSSAGAYYLFNITTIIDALDHEHSQIKYWPRLKKDTGPRRVDQVNRYAFHSNRLEAATIFKVPEYPLTSVYATDSFVDRVRKAGLLGFDFRLLWPLDEFEAAQRQKYLEKWKRKHGKQ
jgi:hypothetical protein